MDMPRGNSHLTGEALAASVSRYKLAGRRAWEKRMEREEAVTVNLAPELLPLWAVVGSEIKGTPEERLAAFEQYAHDHPSEVLDAQVEAAAAKLEALLRDRHEADEKVSAEVPF
jgi:hypothetical protein